MATVLLQMAPLYVTRPKPARAKVGGSGLCGGGRAGVARAAIPATIIQSAAPAIRTRRPKPRALIGNNGLCGDGVASAIVTPLGTPGPVMPPMTWMGSPGYRPVPHKAWVGGSYGPYGGVLGPQPQPVVTVPATAYRPHPFIARNVPPARARVGPQASSCAAGVASQVVTPLGRPPQPAPRPVIVHLPPHRAKVGPGTYLAAGVASQITTPLGFRQQPPPRPVFVHVPPARARLGLRGQAAGGVASAVSTPLGSPSQPAPRPVIQHLPPRRLVWRGLATQNYPPAAAAARAHPFVFRSPAPARARLGNNLTCADGVASQVVTPIGAPQPFISPLVAHIPAPARARLGNAGRPGAGLASKAVTPPLGTPSRPKPFVFRSPAPGRARLGNNLLCGDGLASSIVTPLGTPSRPRPFVFRSPAPARARLGASLQLAGGVASQVGTPLGSPARPKPFVFRSPAPARGRIGPRGLISAGVASSVVTPLGQIPPARKVPIFPPKVTRARIGRGTVAGGIASAAITPVTPIPVTGYQRPAPQIRRPAPARAWAGHSTTAGGVASQVFTTFGAPQPTVPVVEFRPPPPARAVWRGFASELAPQTPARPKPFVFRSPAPARARLGTSLQPAGGLASQIVTPRGAPQPTVPVLEFRPPPGRGRWRGIAVRIPVTIPVTAYRRSPPLPRSPAPHRVLWHGFAAPPIPFGAPQPTVPVVEFRPPPPARALWRGFAAPYARLGPQYPLGTPQPALPYVEFRPPPPPRAVLPHRIIGLVNLPPPVPVVTAYRRPPVQIRRPVPQLGQVGPFARAVSAGVASQVVTPLGAPQPTVPVSEFRPPPPSRTRVLWRGLASRVVTPMGAMPQPRKVPVFPPKITRARIGHGTVAGGIASAAVTPAPTLGTPQPTVPVLEFRPPPPHRALWRGAIPRVQVPVIIPATSYRRPPPQIQHLPPHRAVWRGLASPVVTPRGAAQPTVPVVEYRPPPPHRALWRGLAAPYARIGPQYPLGLPQPSLPLVEFRPPPPPRAVTPHRIIGVANLPPPPPPTVPPPVTVIAAPAAPMTIVINPAAPMTIDVVFAPPMGVDVTPPGRIAQPGPAHVDPPGQQLITQQPAVLLRPA